MEQNYFIWHEKKRKFKTSLRKSEEKGEFESPNNESLVFQRGFPNHAWTQYLKTESNHHIMWKLKYENKIIL